VQASAAQLTRIPRRRTAISPENPARWSSTRHAALLHKSDLSATSGSREQTSACCGSAIRERAFDESFVGAYPREVLIHSVYFWFKADADPARVAEFDTGLRRLIGIEQIRHAYIGRPERTPLRPVIDASYDWALIVHFESLADHDVYQEHALHLEFLDRFSATWQQVRVYDVQV
jgi:hypothetical protein